LPSDAWRAALALAAPAPGFKAGKPASLELTVRNESQAPWPRSANVAVGHHWRARTGELLAADEGRTPLEGTVAPGESRRVRFIVVAPAEPGSYELELDLIQEWVGWFAGRGSPSLRMEVQVDAADQRLAGHPRSAPTIEMHALSRAEVTKTVEAAGGVVLQTVPRERCGPNMPSFDYVVGRDPAGPRRRFPRWLKR
jgi:hypothetical protein